MVLQEHSNEEVEHLNTSPENTRLDVKNRLFATPWYIYHQTIYLYVFIWNMLQIFYDK